jgi:hypothetical protein
MRNKITKKDVLEFKTLINKYGYWSEQVKQFNEQFTYDALQRLHKKAKQF